MDIISNLLLLIECESELKACTSKIGTSISNMYNECLNIALDNNSEALQLHKFKIESVLDYLHDESNTGHWSEVPLSTREAFTACSFLKAVIMLKLNPKEDLENLQSVLKCIDMGLLLGAPLTNNRSLLTESASIVSKKLSALNFAEVTGDVASGSSTKRKIEDVLSSFKGTNICRLSLPTVEGFYKQYMLPERPVIIQDSMSHWAACKKWMDVNYLLKVAGSRTVPVEIGSEYSNENWSQKLMTLKDFIQQHFLSDSQETGYLAQHNLLDHIPELQADISIPDYCCMTRSEEDEDSQPEINVWMGPAGTISSMHFDPKDNLLAQVFGRKQIILFSPKDSQYLYPHEGKLLSNTAQLNPTQPDLDKYPDFLKAQMYKCVLEPGEMLYIPPKWWHHVVSLEKSFSVNFWWQ